MKVDIWAIRPNGKGLVPLVRSPDKDMEASWSPDGNRLVFRVQKLRVDSPTAGQLAIREPSGKVRPLTRPRSSMFASDFEPAWSPKGDRIAFASDRPGGTVTSIYTISPQGTGLKRVTRGGNDTSPTWSPDGKRLAFVRSGPISGSILVARADGTGVRELGHTRADVVGNLAWSPDGKTIAYAAILNRSFSTTAGISFVDVATGAVRHPAGTLTASEDQPSWSPDGRMIAYVTEGDIYVMNADGTGRRPLVTGPDLQVAPAWGKG